MTLDTQNNRPFIGESSSRQHEEARYNIVVVTQNEVDLTLMKKLLESMGNCKVYEAGNLKSTFKITSHIPIDLIIVDEKLPSAEGFEIIDRLNRRELLKDVPKILLINNDFKKERYDSYRDINLDFMRKPIDTVMLKARVTTLFKNMHKKPTESIFEEMMVQKIEEAKAFLGIYKSFLEVDENILFIYDKQSNKIIEANKVFMRFFEDVATVNRILGSKHLLRRFVPHLEDANYLNHYDFHEWDKIAAISNDFQFALKIVREGTPYSFSIRLRRTEIVGEEMYVVKLLNNHNYLPETRNMQEDFEACRGEVNEALQLLKGEIEEEESKRSYQKIYRMIHKISELVNVGHKEDVIAIESDYRREVNTYFIIASLLKRYASYKTLYLNGVKVGKELEENQEEIYVPVDPDALQDAVKGIIDSYFTAPVQYDKRRIRLDLYRAGSELKVEIRASERKEAPRRERSVIDKLLKKEQLNFTSGTKNDILPKNVQVAIQRLDAEVEHFSADGDTIFLITVPIMEKVK